MTSSRAIDFLFLPGIEGGTSMDPEDSGNWTGGKQGVGELLGTRWGIAAASGLPLPNTEAEAREIYHVHFWKKYDCAKIPAPLDFLFFDARVNQTSLAPRMLQRAVGAVDDGIIGPRTIAAANKAVMHDFRAAVSEFTAQRMFEYMKHPKAARFGLGWARRIARAQEWALTRT